MVLMFLLIVKVDDLRANYSGSTVALADICLKPLSTDCATQSVLQVMILSIVSVLKLTWFLKNVQMFYIPVLCLIWFIQTTIEVIASMLNAAVFPAGS